MFSYGKVNGLTQKPPFSSIFNMPSTLKGFGVLLCMLFSCVLVGGGEGKGRRGEAQTVEARSLASRGEATVAAKLSFPISFPKLYQVFLLPPER